MLLQESLENSARLFPDKAALIFKDKVLSYLALDQAANSLANALIERGLRRQDRVIIYLPTCIETVVSLYAILKAGGIFVIVNNQVKASKFAFINNNSDAGIVITDKHGLMSLPSPSECPNLRTVVVADFSSEDALSSDKRWLSFYDILGSYSKTRPGQSCIDIDLASLIYTSGSTGDPKGVMLTHLNMLTAARSIIQYIGNDSNDIIIDVLPLSFDYGLYQVLMSVIFGGTVVLENSFLYPSQILGSMIRHHVTGFPIVPTIAASILTLRDLKGSNYPDLRYITNTGQSLPPAHITRLREVFPKVKLFSMYGLTECKRVSYLPPEELGERPTSVGKAIPNTEVYLVDESGKEITQSTTPGQLVVRGAHVMAGYWKLPDKTAECLRPGRYPGERVLYTGDIFEKDEDGFLYFLRRSDDMFKSGGQFVSPKEVENVLHACEGVAEAAVIGIDDKLLGKVVTAFIVKCETSASSDDIIAFCLQRLEKHMVPKKIVFCDSIPKAPNGKILKTALYEIIRGGSK
jgi:long-chain acyl-CoA synthetase